MDDMNDHDLEALLRRHRPVGPQPALRDRILRAEDPHRSWWWLGAAAALLAIIVGTQIALGSAVDTLAVTLATGTDTSEPDPLLDLVGDDESARQLAMFRRAEREARRAFDSPPAHDPLDGEGQ